MALSLDQTDRPLKDTEMVVMGHEYGLSHVYLVLFVNANSSA